MNPNLHGWGRRSAAEPSGAGQDRAHGRGAPMKREAGAVLFGGSGDSTGMRRDATSLQHMMWLAEQQHAQQQARMHHVQQMQAGMALAQYQQRMQQQLLLRQAQALPQSHSSPLFYAAPTHGAVWASAHGAGGAAQELTQPLRPRPPTRPSARDASSLPATASGRKATPSVSRPKKRPRSVLDGHVGSDAAVGGPHTVTGGAENATQPRDQVHPICPQPSVAAKQTPTANDRLEHEPTTTGSAVGGSKREALALDSRAVGAIPGEGLHSAGDDSETVADRGTPIESTSPVPASRVSSPVQSGCGSIDGSSSAGAGTGPLATPSQAVAISVGAGPSPDPDDGPLPSQQAKTSPHPTTVSEASLGTKSVASDDDVDSVLNAASGETALGGGGMAIAWGEVQQYEPFTALAVGSNGRHRSMYTCNFCRKRLHGGTNHSATLVIHMGELGTVDCLACVDPQPHTLPLLRCLTGYCKAIPKHVQAIMDKHAVQMAALKQGKYGKNGVFDQFDVIGWLRNVCRACNRVVRGGSSACVKHAKVCLEVMQHFQAVPTGGIDKPVRPPTPQDHKEGDASPDATPPAPASPCVYRCNHCAAITRCSKRALSALRQHMGRCSKLPASARRVMDARAVQNWRKRASKYGKRVYEHFEVTGWQVAKCRTCSRTVLGSAARLASHLVTEHAGDDIEQATVTGDVPPGPAAAASWAGSGSGGDTGLQSLPGPAGHPLAGPAASHAPLPMLPMEYARFMSSGVGAYNSVMQAGAGAGAAGAAPFPQAHSAYAAATPQSMAMAGGYARTPYAIPMWAASQLGVPDLVPWPSSQPLHRLGQDAAMGYPPLPGAPGNVAGGHLPFAPSQKRQRREG